LRRRNRLFGQQRYFYRADFHDISAEEAGNIEMNSQKIAGILGTIVAVGVLAAAVAFGPIGQLGKPQQVQKVDQPAQPAPAPPVRGPVVREVPQ
jgi:hypothetical protein